MIHEQIIHTRTQQHAIWMRKDKKILILQLLRLYLYGEIYPLSYELKMSSWAQYTVGFL